MREGMGSDHELDDCHVDSELQMEEDALQLMHSLGAVDALQSNPELVRDFENVLLP